jgi:hypothetical protein
VRERVKFKKRCKKSAEQLVKEAKIETLEVEFCDPNVKDCDERS